MCRSSNSEKINAAGRWNNNHRKLLTIIIIVGLTENSSSILLRIRIKETPPEANTKVFTDTGQCIAALELGR